MKQQTIKRPVKAIGIGLHTGLPVQILLEPLNEDSGIVFYRSDLAISIPLKPENVINTQMATVIGKNNASISTIEHFLAVIYAYGIDNLRVSVNSSEMPAMDGSSISFCLLLDEAGIQIQNKNKKFLKINKTIEIQEEDKYVKITPSTKPILNFKIDFNHPIIGKEEFEFRFSKQSFIDEIARARTFGFAKDIQYLQSQGLALGASLQNAIGLDDHQILNREGLRFDNEFVRHKILDAMGDLMVIGYNILGSYESFSGGHKLNNQLVRKILSKEKNYEFIEVENKYYKEYEINKAFA